MPASPQHYPVKLTQDQRKVVAEIVPEPTDRLKFCDPPQRTIQFMEPSNKAEPISSMWTEPTGIPSG
jgi:hypothetical protein